ncbi:MAG: oligosaccharide flippase family protein, partial [Lachnospira sp.]|nr:oligosaccharide flippase family protein [Lachnospira sp.]
MSESKQKFLIHGGILAITGILVRIIGMFYRIPLVNIIGEEGSGIYSVAFNIYNIMLVLSSYGMPMAVSKLMSAYLAKKEYRNAGLIYKCSLIVSAVTGGIAAIILYFGAEFIESIYKGVPGLAIPLRVLAPTIF